MSKPEICAGEITFRQDNHTESSFDCGELLRVKQYGMIGEPYWTLNTEGGEWSFDSLEELTETVNRAICALTEAEGETQ